MEQSLLNLFVAFGVGLTLFFVVMALRKGDDQIRSRVESLQRNRRSEDLHDLSRPFADRVLMPVVDGVADRVFAIMPGGLQEGLRQKLVMAGEPTNVAGYMAATAIGAGVLGMLGLALGVATASSIGGQQLLVALVLAGTGALLPYLWLNSRVRSRQSSITKSLPDAFDLITTCVEAGLGLDAALARVAEKVTGPFAQELSRTLREIGLGRSRRDALKDLGDRTGVVDLATFVNAVVQAEQMGTSIGQVLRVQSDQMRLRRRHRAEELAHQAPVKMVFPLVICIFPTLFIVILGPAGISIYDSLIK